MYAESTATRLTAKTARVDTVSTVCTVIITFQRNKSVKTKIRRPTKLIKTTIKIGSWVRAFDIFSLVHDEVLADGCF